MRSLVDELGDVRRLGCLNIESDSHKPCDFTNLRDYAPLYASTEQTFPLQVQALGRDAILRFPAGIYRNMALTLYDFLDELPADCPARDQIGKDRHPTKLRIVASKLWTGPKGIANDAFRKGPELKVREMIAREVRALVSQSLADAQSGIPAAHSGNDVPAPGEVIGTREMSCHEAIEAIKDQLSDTSNDDAERLAHSLHYHPLVIRYACRLIQQGNVTITSFCDDLDKHIAVKAAIAEDLPTATGAVLLSVIKDMLVFLWRQDKLAFDMLVVISIIQTRVLNWGSIAGLLEQESARLPRTRHAIAIRKLRELAIIEQNKIGQIKIHPLLRDVLYHLFWQGVGRHENDLSLVDALHRAGQLIDFIEAEPRMWATLSIVEGFGSFTSGPARLRPRPGGECARVCQTRDGGPAPFDVGGCSEPGNYGICRMLNDQFYIESNLRSHPEDSDKGQWLRQLSESLGKYRVVDSTHGRWHSGDLTWYPDKDLELSARRRKARALGR